MTSKSVLMRSLLKSLDSPVEAKVTGTIPSWVSGTLYRNGGGRYEYGDKHYKHLFDGKACVHKFSINNGKVNYFNKLLETKSYKKSLKDNRLYPEFGTADLSSSIFGRIKSLFAPGDITDNTNVNIVPYANKQLYALTETHYLMQLNPENLSISKRLSVSKAIPSSFSIIAHPHVEPDGSWIDMGMNKTKPGYDFVRYDGSKMKTTSDILDGATLINSVPSSHKLGLSYFHSFGLSQNYIIFLEQALKFDFIEFTKGRVFNKTFCDALKMDPKWDTRIHLINKHTGEIIQQKFTTDPLFIFHHINAYEQIKNGKNEIVVDVCAYDANHFDMGIFQYLDVFTDKLSGCESVKSIARRITIPLDSKAPNPIHCEIKDLNSNLAFELPTINYAKFNAKPYKYMYGINFYKKPYSIVKLNVEKPSETYEIIYDKDGKICLPSEPVFVENPNGKNEDDGVLLVMVLSSGNDFLSVLDAKDLTEIARAELPPHARGAMTFHGFFADSQNYKTLAV